MLLVFVCLCSRALSLLKWWVGGCECMTTFIHPFNTLTRTHIYTNRNAENKAKNCTLKERNWIYRWAHFSFVKKKKMSSYNTQMRSLAYAHNIAGWRLLANLLIDCLLITARSTTLLLFIAVRRCKNSQSAKKKTNSCTHWVTLCGL